jgi:hypothetical protein
MEIQCNPKHMSDCLKIREGDDTLHGGHVVMKTNSPDEAATGAQFSQSSESDSCRLIYIC